MRPANSWHRRNSQFRELFSALLRSRRVASEDGFVLLELVMAIAVITVVMTALSTFFVTTMSSTAQQRARQGAIHLADSAMELVHGLGEEGAVAGRSAAGVSEQWGTTLATTDPVKSWLTSMGPATDTSPSGSPALPTTPVVQTLNGLKYYINYFVGWCLRPTADMAAATPCKAKADGTYGWTAADTGYTQYVRAVVAITWADKTCAASTCTYLTATLLNGGVDPTFNYNSAPPPLPVLGNCQPQYSAFGDTISRSILAATPSAPGCRVTAGGVPAFTYGAAGLPGTLTMDATTGLVTGNAGPVNTSGTTVTITVTDGFLKTNQTPQTFKWIVYPALILTAPTTTDRYSSVGQSVSVASTATGGKGPYAWSAAGLPAGLKVDSSSGVISGAPTSAGTSAVTLTVVDTGTASSKAVTFNWNIFDAPLVVGNPGTQTTSRTAVVSLELDVTGGSGTYQLAATNLPTGLALDQNGLISGTVDPSNTLATRTVTVTATDSVTGQVSPISFTWTVTAAPTLLPVHNQTTLRGATVSLPTGTCASGCTYTLSGAVLPPGLTINPTTGLISGTVQNVNGVYPGIKIKVRDSSNATAETATFQWNVTDLRVAIPNQSARCCGNRSLNLTPLTTGGAGPYTYTSIGSDLPPVLSVNGAQISGYANYPWFNSNKAYPGLIISVTDSSGATVSSNTFQWNITW